jgi:hypothetical protein
LHSLTAVTTDRVDTSPAGSGKRGELPLELVAPALVDHEARDRPGEFQSTAQAI